MDNAVVAFCETANRREAEAMKRGIATLLASGLSNQFGAAVGSLAFPVIGPAGVVAVRQVVAAIVLLPIARPKLRSYSWSQWWPVLLLALVFGLMNLSLYSAIERIGLGLAVTLEFLGPLGVALFASRSKLTLVCGLVAAAGVVAIARPEPTTDYLGIVFGLVGGACWASYILLNRTIGKRMVGIEGTAVAAGVSSIVFLPIGIVILATTQPPLWALAFAGTAGVLCSAFPYVADMIALRTVPAHLFGLLMSINPIYAALIGAVFLSQSLGLLEWIGIVLIVSTNVAALALARTKRTAPIPILV